MTFEARSGEQDLPLAQWKRIDSVCDRFEAAVRAGQHPDAEQFLREVDAPARALLFRELLALELEARRDRGEHPEAADYHERFPEYTQAIDDAFAFLALDGTTLHPRRARGSGAPFASARTSRPTQFNGEFPRAELNPAVIEALRVEGYEVASELGRGGMGVVYLARKTALGRLCALKMILAGAHAGAAALARFQAEAAAIARLQHPDIVQIYHIGEADGLPYLELEYLPGGGLDQVLDGTPRPPESAARLVEVVARAIAFAHRQGIVHRDLKPANIMLDATGGPKVADFGLAKILGSDDGLTRSRAVMGSPSYMAPEQAEGDVRAVGTPADVYALGAVLYELLTGRPPFRAATALLTMVLVKQSDPVPPSRFQPGLPADVETICLKCLEKAPARRYATADLLAEDLHRFLTGEPILARPVPSWVRAWKWARRRKALAGALCVSAAAIFLLFAGALYYNSRLQVSVREAIRQRQRTLKNLNQLVFEVHDKLGKNPATRAARREVLDTALAGLEEVAESAKTAAPDIGRAVAHQRLGDIFREIGRMEDAGRQYESARVLAEELASGAPADHSITQCLLRAFAGLGDLSLHANRLQEAVHHFHRAVDLAEADLTINPDRAAARANLLDAYFRLGRAYGFDRRLDSAAVWFSKMQQLAESWGDDEPRNNLPRSLLSIAYRKLADCWKIARDDVTAQKDYLKAVALAADIVKAEPANQEYKRDLAQALDDLAATQYHLGQLDQAFAQQSQAVQLFSEVVASDPDEVDNRVRLFQSEFNLGRVEMDQLHLSAALGHLRHAHAGLVKLDREGKFVGRPRDRAQLLPAFEGELANSEAVASLADVAALKSPSPAEAARLLRIGAGALASAGRLDDLAATAEALLGLDAHEAEDLYAVGRSLAWCSGCIAEKPWPARSTQALKALRARFAERSIALLVRAIDHGLRYSHRLEADEFLRPIRQHPGFHQITQRITTKAPEQEPPRALTLPGNG